MIDAGAKKIAKSSLNETPLSCVKRMRANTKLFDMLTTHPKQLNLWPAKWLEEERRGMRNGANGRRRDRGRGWDEEDDDSGRDSGRDSARDSARDGARDDREDDYDDDYED